MGSHDTLVADRLRHAEQERWVGVAHHTGRIDARMARITPEHR
jgi:hypothetical protein